LDRTAASAGKEVRRGTSRSDDPIWTIPKIATK
jgi:predicted ester cyclase/ribosome-binding protein aMBF1 (putative translation factor)